MSTEDSNTKKEPKGFKRKKAFEITQKNWDSEKQSIDLKKTVDEIAEAIGVNFGGAKSYFAFFAKEEHNNFIIPGLKNFWEKELKGSRVNGTTKKTENKNTDGGTKAEATKTEKKTGGTKETRTKLSEVLKNRQAKASTDKLTEALKAAHPDKVTSTETTAAPEEEKVAA